MVKSNKNKKSEVLSILKQALKVNRKPFPWVKAFSAGLAASLPVIIGLLFGSLEYGLIAGLGGFTYLYVFDIPYAQRAKKIFFVVLGMTLVTILGTLAAPYPLAVAILMGVIGATVIFIFGSLRIAGPSAIFFVLVFAMVSGMPVNPELAPLRAALVFLGASLSWVIAMIGWLFDPYGAEETVVKRVYIELANLIDSIGTNNFNTSRHNMMSVLREADETLTKGYISWRETDLFKRLYLLNQHANKIFIYITEHFIDTQEKLPQELGQTVRELANSFDKKNKIVYEKIPQPSEMDEAVSQLFAKIYDADAIMNEPTTRINQVIQTSKLSLKTIFGGAFDKNSIVFITALRFGLITTIAAIIAFEFELTRSYWVPLSCVAVMSGATIVATHHRAIQRGIGTVIGIIIASLVLTMEPSGYIIALIILILTFITELFIVKNYGLAALFFTPNALLMAESTSVGSFSFSYFASSRIIDVIIGSVIGLIGVWLIGRKSASSRIPHFIGKTIRSQTQLLLVLFSEQEKGFNVRKSKELRKMRINLTNLKTLYNTASGEIPIQRETLDYYWNIVFSIEHLAYLLEESSKMERRPILSDKVLAQLLYACEMMANPAGLKRPSSKKIIPKIEGYPSINKELEDLQKAIYR
ncbi:FUSC family protein [Oceanobacillus zhaokaii]|uniref:FUSC family protein n=1 Tax=Oceanobacillus zhaokaii TaxID=2052660 RepID=A0A345PE80_9BACI|nr:FUSC family protein [Oceanobacillus zhaokaii]AXI08310.1 FUSC family protein [Oceanobacillus zhaokaii]